MHIEMYVAGVSTKLQWDISEMLRYRYLKQFVVLLKLNFQQFLSLL